MSKVADGGRRRGSRVADVGRGRGSGSRIVEGRRPAAQDGIQTE